MQTVTGSKRNASIEADSIDVSGNITLSGTVDGRDIATDGTKLDGIESGATADQTASEILTAIKTVDGASSGLDADLLDGLHASQFLRSDASTTISTTTPVLSLNDTDSTTTTNQVGYISFKNNGTETGWVGFGSSIDSDFTVRNTSGAVELYGSDGAKVTGKLLVNGADDNGGNAKFAVDLNADPVIAINGQQVRVGNTSSNYSYKMMYSGGNAYMDTWASNLYLRSTGGSVDRDIIIIPNRLGAATEAARFTGAGSLLINATAPVASEKLLVAGSTHIQVASGLEQLRLERTGTSTGTAVLGAGSDGLQIMDSSYNKKMYIGTAGTYNGRVGIRTSSPSTTLDVVGNAKVSTHIIAREMRTSTGQELILNAGESASYATGQINEYVYINAESGLEINSSPDNWATGWAGRQTAYINNSAGDSTFPGNLTIQNNLYINNSSTALSEGTSGDQLRITTPSGYVDIGPQNTGWAHFVTDRPSFYFAQLVTFGANRVDSYNGDFEIRRVASATARMRITSGTTYSDQDMIVDGDIKTNAAIKIEETSVGTWSIDTDASGDLVFSYA